MSIARTSAGLEGALLIDANGAVVISGVMPTTSVWSASDAAANAMTLSNGGLTVTPSGTAVWNSIRSSISKTSGKLYVEFAVSGTVDNGENALFGLASSGFTISSWLGNSNYSGGERPNVACYVSTGFNVNAGQGSAIPASGDVWAIAVDFAAGNIWIAANNVWQASGAPATGASPMMTFVPATVGALFPTMTFQASPGVWTLQPTAASQKYAPPAGFQAWDGDPTTHSSQALAYLARTVGGNEGGNGPQIAKLIDGLVADGVWSKLDALYILAQQNVTDARLNLIGATFTLPTGPTFTAYRGLSAFPSPGLDTGFNATTAPSPHFVQNSASLGAWAYDTPDAGVQIGTDNVLGGSLIQANFSGTMYVDVNNTLGDVTLAAPATNGWYSAERTSSTNINIYFNNTNKGAFTHTSAAPDNHDMFIGGLFAPGNVTAKTISAAYWGASLGPTLQLALYNRLRAYMTSVGVP